MRTPIRLPASSVLLLGLVEFAWLVQLVALPVGVIALAVVANLVFPPLRLIEEHGAKPVVFALEKGRLPEAQ